MGREEGLEMNPNGVVLAGYDPWVFARNRQQYTQEMLAPYLNQWVA